MKSYHALAAVTLVVLWNAAGAQTSTPAQQDAAPGAAPQQQQTTPDSTPSDASARLPASKNAATGETAEKATSGQAATSGRPTNKMSGGKSGKTHVAQHKHKKSAKSAHAAGNKSARTAHHGTKAAGDTAALTQEEKDYRTALRQCAGKQDASARDSCLDGAIEQFRRNG